jgi:Fe-S-cluster-containing dehydrogenase component
MLNPEKKVVMICDLCDGNPKCIDSCPEEALELVTEDKSADMTWAAAVQKLLLDVTKLTSIVKSGKLDPLLSQVNEKMRRLEEKLEALFNKEVELHSKAT